MLRARVQYRQRRNFLAEYRKKTLQRNNAFAYGNIAVEWKSHISSHKKEEKELLLLFFMSFYQRQGSTPPSGTASQRFAPIVRRASSPLRNRGMSSGRGLPTVMDCPSRYVINGMKSSGKKRDNSGSIGRLLGGMCNSIAEYATKKEGIQPSFFAVVSLTLVNPF